MSTRLKVESDGDLTNLDLPPPPSPDELAESSQLERFRVAGEIVDLVRHAVNISHEKSQVAVQLVIQLLQRNYEDSSDFSSRLSSLLECLETPSAISKVPELIKTSTDAKRLKTLFKILSACKDDEQQRSWAVHEDELEIDEALKDLQSILVSADPSISKYVMRSNQYHGVQSLALLYQMETRQIIRTKLRDVFIAICQIDMDALIILVDSVLPMEIAREFKDCGQSDRSRMMHISKLLTLLMSTGEPLPTSHYDHLNDEFILAVLKTIEAAAEAEEELPNELINFILAYNLQFQGINNNLTVEALSSFDYAPFFSQRLIYLLNWGKDPLDTEFPHGPPTTNSVLKILTDIFSSKKAVDIFYINDIVVLIDLLVRWLTDLGPGDEHRLLFLKLVQLILRNPCYSEHNYRLCECLNQILLEEDSGLESCQRLIRDIFAEFPILNGTDDDLEKNGLR